MTLIVGAAHRGRVWLAGDGLMTGKRCRVPIASPKVWTAAGGAVLLGVTGHMGARAALANVPWQAGARWLERDAPGEIASALLRAGIEADEIALVVGALGRFWYCAAAETYEAADTFAAAGSAEAFALGWLAATRSGWGCAERLRACIKAAAIYCPAVGGPITVVHT